MSEKLVKIAIDIGSATTKCAFAYFDELTSCYGKVCPNNEALQGKGYPSIGYYDEESQEWVFGEKVYESRAHSFKNIVKITDLLSMLIPTEVRGIEKDDAEHYYSGHHFPIFYFPNKIKNSDTTYGDTISSGRTFVAKQTPHEVVLSFFQTFCKEYLLPTLSKMTQKGLIASGYIALYPIRARKKYINELVDIIKETLSYQPQTISATKSVGLFAYASGYLPSKCSAIVVNIGERDTSLAKIKCNNGYITVDGQDAHSEPLAIAGDAYDEILGDIVRAKVGHREVLGMTRENENNFFMEVGTHEQQFNLLQNIKKAKTIFALPEERFALLHNKVRMCVQRDVSIEVAVTKDELLRAINQGVNVNGKGILPASTRIADYILDEIARENNIDVDTVILSGGACEMIGLAQLIENRIKDVYGKKVKVIHFQNATGGDFETIGDSRIKNTERHLYSASVGAAILSTKKYKFITQASLSYGTWYYEKNTNMKKLKILIKRGMIIPEEGNIYSAPFKANEGNTHIDNEEFFSTMSPDSIYVGEPKSKMRQEAIQKHSLKVISGTGARICFGRQKGDKIMVTKVPSEFRFLEGIEIDQDGRAKPYIANADSRKEYQDILVFFQGVKSFEISSTVKEGR